MAIASETNTLQEAILYFADPDNCLNYLVARRWPKGVTCPTCGRTDVALVPARRVWQCKTRHPKAQFSIKVGTIFEDSPITLDKWLLAMWMLANCNNGVSSYEISRATGISQKSTWFMLQRLRLALQGEETGKPGGSGSPAEVDETFIGGKAGNMHPARKLRAMDGKTGGYPGKAIVHGSLERGGKVRASVVERADFSTLAPRVRDHVEDGAHLRTDQAAYYNSMGRYYAHEVINHLHEYVNGSVHTNTIENFWSLLKRELHGTYVSVEPFHLFRYVDEQAFRYNTRKDSEGNKITDGERFDLRFVKS